MTSPSNSFRERLELAVRTREGSVAARVQGTGGAAERGFGVCGGLAGGWADVEPRPSGPCLGRQEVNRLPTAEAPHLAQTHPDVCLVCPTGSSAGPPVTPRPGAGQTCRTDPSLGIKFKLLAEVHKGLAGAGSCCYGLSPDVS